MAGRYGDTHVSFMGERAMNLRRCTHWTAREDEMLICMIKNGASSAMIAQKLGRTAEGVSSWGTLRRPEIASVA